MTDILKEVEFLIFVCISCVASIPTKEYTDKSTGYRYSVHRDRVTWIQAYEFCKTNNSELLYIETVAELQFIKEFLNNSTGVRNIQNRDRLWTSGSDIFLENRHIWIPTGKPILATLWAPGEPNNEKRGEHCTEVLQWSSPFVNLYLNDALCSDEKHFVCKRLMVVAETNLTEMNCVEKNQINAHLKKEESESKKVLYVVLVIISLASAVLIALLVKFRKAILIKLQSGNNGGRIALYQHNGIDD